MAVVILSLETPFQHAVIGAMDSLIYGGRIDTSLIT